MRRKTAVIRDAVDTSIFHPLPRVEARGRLGLSLDEVLVIFPHDVTQPTKRFWLAERAIENLRAWLPEARLWLVNGRPPDEMPWYYAAADAMIVTSVREGGPSSVKEALACGVPVVSVDVGDTTIFSQADGWVVRADSAPNSLANALRDVLNKTAREPRASRLPEGLDMSNAALEMESVYRTALQRRGIT